VRLQKKEGKNTIVAPAKREKLKNQELAWLIKGVNSREVGGLVRRLGGNQRQLKGEKVRPSPLQGLRNG